MYSITFLLNFIFYLGEYYADINRGIYKYPLIIGSGIAKKTIYLDLGADYQHDNKEPTKPLGKDGPWIYDGIALSAYSENEFSIEETIFKIKHAVIRYKKKLEQMKNEIENYEKNKKF